MKSRELPLFRNEEARKLLRSACRRHAISLDLLRDLLEVQRRYAGSGRQHGINADFNACIADFLEQAEE